MRGSSPCLERSANYLQQLQDKAIAQSPLLREIDTHIGEANNKINEAKARNQKSIQQARANTSPAIFTWARSHSRGEATAWDTR